MEEGRTLQKPLDMASQTSGETVYIVALVEAAGARKIYSQREQDPDKGGYLEITFEAASPNNFANWIKRQGVKDLFTREEGEYRNRFRLRTPQYFGERHERYANFLKSLKDVEVRLGGKVR